MPLGDQHQGIGAGGGEVHIGGVLDAVAQPGRAVSMAAGSQAMTETLAAKRLAMTTSGGDSRTSSVSGLNAKPQIAICVPPSAPSKWF